MRKGYKRNKKGMAVLNFVIGLIVLAIAVFIIVFFLNILDYSDRLPISDATPRPYVEMTAAPSEIYAEETPEAITDVVDVSATEQPTPTPVITATPSPTAYATPVPTAIPKATAEPTAIPEENFTPFMTDGFKVPDPTDSAKIGITRFQISAPNDGKVIVIDGYGYVDDASFDASTLQSYLIVTHASSGKQLAYKCSMIPGISGEEHSGAQCMNVSCSDFETILDISSYRDSEYTLGLVLTWQQGENKSYSYHVFEKSFTVSAGTAAVSETPVFGA